MPDLARDWASIIASYADNTAKAILAQTSRDLVKSAVWRRVAMNSSGTIVHDFQNGNYLEITMVGNIAALSVTNGVEGLPFRLMLKQDGTGTRTWAGLTQSVRQGAVTATLTTTPWRRDFFEFVWDGTDWVQTAYTPNLG